MQEPLQTLFCFDAPNSDGFQVSASMTVARSTRVKWVPFVLLASFPLFYIASKLAIFPLKRSVLGA